MKRIFEVMTALAAAMAMVLGTSVSAAGSDADKNAVSAYVQEQFFALDEADRTILEDEIYNEKYAPAPMGIINEDDEVFIDEAYQNMMEKENYIVSLIQTQSGSATSLKNWEYNLDYLQAHYNDIKNSDDIDLMHVDSYMEDYKIVRNAKAMPAAQINGIRTRVTSYSFYDAIAYAEKYYSSYNSSYPDWTSYGGDCANFISQCLYAGGRGMRGTPGSSAAAQDWANWFSTGSSCNTNNVSSTWRGANAFKSYWQSNASGYSTFSSVGPESFYYGFKGDAVSLLNSNGSAYHTLIIVGYDSASKDFIVAAHTSSTKTAKLSGYSAPGGFVIFNMR